jgi:hypothetical protein
MDEDCEDMRFEVEEETVDRGGEFSDESANEMLGTATGWTTKEEEDFDPDEFDWTDFLETRSLEPDEDLPEMNLILDNIYIL